MAWYQQYPAPDPGLVKQLTAQQNEMRQRVIIQKPDFELKTIAGCDSSFIGENILSVLAKKILAGKYEEPGPEKGNITPIIHQKEIVGNVLRTKEKVKPVFVSVGHLMDLENATEIALKTALKHKLPEPTRLADHYAEVFKSEVREN